MKFHPEPNVERIRKGQRGRFLSRNQKVRTLLMWIAIFVGVFLVLRAFGGEWPESVKRRSCEETTYWRLGECTNTYIVIDCEGNVWSLVTAGEEKNSAVIKEDLLWTADDLREALPDKKPKPKKKEWWEK